MKTAPNPPRLRDIQDLITPAALLAEIPPTQAAAATVHGARTAIQHILSGQDDRLLVVIGPCSIHDPEAALDYAKRLAELRGKLSGGLEIVMRAYFEKPRTTIGWKGLINDPHLDGSFDINHGLRTARALLDRINAICLPVGCEFLDTTTPHYIADQVAWAAIGARTTESQVHREMASGLPCPVGFKNGTSGDVTVAIDAIKASAHPHRFPGIGATGRPAISVTTGNPDGHIILRGGLLPNYDAASVDAACRAAQASGVPGHVMIDTSHGNSSKNPDNQPHVARDIAGQIAGGERRILGVMIESNLVGGRQNLTDAPLTYGQSVTDGCIDWETSVAVLQELADAVADRRRCFDRLAS